MPHLVGRARAVLGEHPTFDRILDRVSELSDALQDPASLSVSESRRLMDDFITRMRAHFDAEEGEYFATLIAAAPSLRPAVERLRREHDSLLALAQTLRDAVGGDAPDAQVQEKLGGFIEQFKRHEHEEASLFQEFLAKASEDDA